MKSLKSNKGFTLIELVVVIAILGILAGIAIPRFMDATATARGAKVVADLRTIDSAVMMYQAKNGSLPADNTKLYTSGSSTNLLASWPTSPKGTAIINNNSGTAVTWTVSNEYVYSSTANEARATIGGKSVDAILNDKKGGTL